MLIAAGLGMVPTSSASHEPGHTNVSVEVDISRGAFLGEMDAPVPTVVMPIPSTTLGFIGVVVLDVVDPFGPSTTTVTTFAFGQTSPCSIVRTLPLVRGCVVLTSTPVVAPNPQVLPFPAAKVCLYQQHLSVKAAGIPVFSTGSLVEPVVLVPSGQCP